MRSRLGVRWTVGDVSDAGWEALRYSIWGAWRLFGESAAFVVCVNTVPLARARALVGDVPDGVVLRDVTHELAPVVAHHLDREMAQGVGWKFAPLRLFPDRYELALDNDCILWRVPRAVQRWFDAPDDSWCVIAEDVRPAFGKFAPLCPAAPRNSGIRGLPPGFDLERTLRTLLDTHPVTLSSELDEQGMQVAAVSLDRAPLVVGADEVTICSPFWPHNPELGPCGAHFVGLNGRGLEWEYYGRPATEWRREHWEQRRPEVRRRVGLD